MYAEPNALTTSPKVVLNASDTRYPEMPQGLVGDLARSLIERLTTTIPRWRFVPTLPLITNSNATFDLPL